MIRYVEVPHFHLRRWVLFRTSVPPLYRWEIERWFLQFGGWGGSITLHVSLHALSTSWRPRVVHFSDRLLFDWGPIDFEGWRDHD